MLPLDYQANASIFAREQGLKLHLDGARVFNAAIRQQVPLSHLTQYYDSVSICLSKGLGAPVGSVLVGSSELITRAHHWRKMAGGGMRQAGVLAAAGIHALENNVERLAEDHRNARELAAGLSAIEELDVDMDAVETNMVFVTMDPDRQAKLLDYLKQRGILAGGYGQLRLVTHHDFATSDIPAVVDAVKAFCRQ